MFLALAAAGCSERASDGTEEKRFTVDPALLGPAYSDRDLQLQFQPPVQFLSADSAFVDRYQQDIRRATRNDPYEVLPSMIFSIPETNARCFVSTFFNSPGAEFDETWRTQYVAAARERARNNQFQSEMVERDGLDILAITVEGVGFVNRRFVFEAPPGRIVQIDYLLPDSLARSLGPAIDSSIGALRFVS